MATNTDSSTQTHTLKGFRKYPSRNGGLRGAKCSCGWEGRAAGPEQRMADFKAHQDEA